MIEPDRIAGFINYKDASYAYEFNKDEWMIYLYPPTHERFLKDYSRNSFFMSPVHNDDEFYDEIVLKGKIFSDCSIYFSCINKEYNYKGFISLEVIWYYCCDTDKESSIDAFSIAGKEVDAFFPPSNFQDIHEKVLDNWQLNINLLFSNNYDLGYFFYKDKKTVHIKIGGKYTLKYDNSTPVITHSLFLGYFKESVDISSLEEVVGYTQRFFMYASRRYNIDLDSARTYTRKDSKYIHTGTFYRKMMHDMEENEVKKGILTGLTLGNTTGRIFTAIKNKQR